MQTVCVHANYETDLYTVCLVDKSWMQTADSNNIPTLLLSISSLSSLLSFLALLLPALYHYR